MVWEQNTVGVIMLNKCVERGMVRRGKGEGGEGKGMGEGGEGWEGGGGKGWERGEGRGRRMGGKG